LRDAVELEWAGVPSVAIVHKTMEGTARAMALVSGMPDYPFITLGYPHIPLAAWTPEEVQSAAEQVVDLVRQRLTAPGRG
jgi:hypothetical protein